MHNHSLTLIIRILAILPTVVLAQFQFSGFADILLINYLNHPPNPEVQYGQFELDLTTIIKPGVNFEGAIAYNSETETFEVGAGFIELIFTGSDGSHHARGEYIDHMGLSIGRFDVPFGIDWQYIASPDRRLVSAPLLNEKSINSWNDMGLNFHVVLGQVHLTSFLVNGASRGFAAGGRIACSPSKMLQLGTSYFAQTKSTEFGNRPQVFGADIQTFTGPLTTRMEVHYSQDIFEGNFNIADSVDAHQGFYIQSNLDLTNIFSYPIVLIGRYDDWSTTTINQKSCRMTLGAAYIVNDALEIRVEYLEDTEDDKQTRQQLAIQSVINF